MIISHRYRFIFIKTLKTAGTSIEIYLSGQCGPQDVVTPIIPAHPDHQPRNHRGFFNHISAYLVRRGVTPALWRSYFKFCVERNPWDKALSHFDMLRRRGDDDLSFDQYLAAGEVGSAWKLYTDDDDETLLVDRVLRYESLNEGLSDTFAQLGIPFSGDLGVHAKRGSARQGHDYRRHYSEAQRQRIAELCDWEIRHLGYRF